MELKCQICERALNPKEEGKVWRSCSICKKPICFDDLHYMCMWRRGLYKDYAECIPACEKCMPKKRRVVVKA
jgi:hypothetical protein